MEELLPGVPSLLPPHKWVWGIVPLHCVISEGVRTTLAKLQVLDLVPSSLLANVRGLSTVLRLLSVQVGGGKILYDVPFMCVCI